MNAVASRKELDATVALHDIDLAMHKAKPRTLKFTHSPASQDQAASITTELEKWLTKLKTYKSTAKSNSKH